MTRMLSRIILGGLMCGTLIIGAWGQTAPPPPGTTQPAQPPARPAAPPQPMLGLPPVEIRPEVLDLGTVRPNQNVSGSVFLQNVSDKWLKIVASKADCTCTTVNLANTMVAPGQSVPLEVQLVTNVMGPWTGRIQVLFDGYDPIIVKATAVVALAVRADPPYVAALKTADGQLPLSGEYDVTSIDGKAYSILAVNGEPPPFVNFDPKSDQPRSTYRLKWDFTEYDAKTCRDSSGQRLPGWIVIETDHPDCPIFDLEVRHECNRRQIQLTDNWAIQEKRVLVGQVKAGEPVEIEIVGKWIPRRTGRDPISAAVTESPQFTVEFLKVETMDDGMRCRVRLTPAADHHGLIHGSIRFHSTRQSASLPVIGTVR